MKRITTKLQRDRQIRRNQLIVGGVLILIMVLSTLGYALSGRTENNSNKKIEYKGIKFVQSSEYWVFQISDKDFFTKYNPEEIKDFTFFSYSSINNYANKPLYFVGEVGEPAIEISQNLNKFVLRIQSACLPEGNCTEDYPIKDCSKDNIIVIREPDEDEKESIYQEENCVFITASYQNQTKYADAFLFKILGI